MITRNSAHTRLPASGDLSGAEGKLAKLNADGTVSVVTAAADATALIVEPSHADVPDPAADVIILGAFSGTAHFLASGPVTPGARLAAQADGTVKAAATGTIVGIAIESAAAGELFEGAPTTPVTKA